MRIDTRSLLARSTPIGDYAAGANGYVTLTLRMPSAKALRCGTTPLVVHLAEASRSMHASSVLSLHVLNACPTNTGPVAPPAG